MVAGEGGELNGEGLGCEGKEQWGGRALGMGDALADMQGMWPHLDAHGPLLFRQLSKEGGEQGGFPCPHWANNSQQTALGHSEVYPGNTGGGDASLGRAQPESAEWVNPRQSQPFPWSLI